jgi:hypothetical protein
MSAGTLLNGGKPLIVTFRDLARATAGFHHWERRYVHSLHDVWKAHAPTPDSIIRHPRGYDERQRQAGNHEARIVPPTALARWFLDVSTARGMPLDWRQCLNMAEGRADLGVDLHSKPLLFEMRTRP